MLLFVNAYFFRFKKKLSFSPVNSIERNNAAMNKYSKESCTLHIHTYFAAHIYNYVPVL